MLTCSLRNLTNWLNTLNRSTPHWVDSSEALSTRFARFVSFRSNRIANTKDESTLVGCIGQPSPLKPYLAENNSLQSSNCNILGLAVTVAFFSNEARFTQIQVFFRACSLHIEVGDPPFFHISGITNSSTFSGKIFREKSMLQNFRANVLKCYCLTDGTALHFFVWRLWKYQSIYSFSL